MRARYFGPGTLCRAAGRNVARPAPPIRGRSLPPLSPFLIWRTSTPLRGISLRRRRNRSPRVRRKSPHAIDYQHRRRPGRRSRPDRPNVRSRVAGRGPAGSERHPLAASRSGRIRCPRRQALTRAESIGRGTCRNPGTIRREAAGTATHKRLTGVHIRGIRGGHHARARLGAGERLCRQRSGPATGRCAQCLRGRPRLER